MTPTQYRTVTHRHLGPVEITLKCMVLQQTNPDPSSVFVEYRGEIIEVSKSLIEELREQS